MGWTEVNSFYDFLEKLVNSSDLQLLYFYPNMKMHIVFFGFWDWKSFNEIIRILFASSPFFLNIPIILDMKKDAESNTFSNGLCLE